MTGQRERPGLKLPDPSTTKTTGIGSGTHGTDQSPTKQVWKVSQHAFDLAAMLRESGIDYDVAEARGYRCTGPKWFEYLTELTELGFSDKQRRAGVIVPLHPVLDDQTRPLVQLRPWKPRDDFTKPGRKIKYETPLGRTLRLDCNPLARDDLADRSVALWITEGVKKADTAISHGLCCIALLGVETWRHLEHEWNSIPLKGRQVFIAFDSDTWTNPNVLKAQDALTEYLVGHGADVWWVRLPAGPGGAKVGIDDYLRAGHVAADLVALAEPERVAAVRRATRNVLIQQDARREADILEWTKRFKEPTSHASLADDLAVPDETLVYRIAGLHLAGMNSLIAAQFKTGKSTLMLNVMRSLVTGEPFLNGLKATPSVGRVAMWNYELSEGQMRAWFRRAAFTDELAKRCALLNLRGLSMPLLSPLGEDWAVQWLIDHGVTSWVIDPFAKAFRSAGGADENRNDQVGQFLDVLDRIKERAGVEDLFMPAHFGRTQLDERARGATVLDDWADSRWILTREDDGNRYLSAEGRDVFLPEAQIVFDEATLRLSFSGESSRKEIKNERQAEAKQAKVLDFLVTHPGALAGEIDSECKLHSSIGPKLRDAMVEAQLLRTETEGKRVRYFVR